MTRTRTETRTAPHYQLVIVGAGLVGASLALQMAPKLAERGMRLALVEAGGEPEHYAGPVFDPRVVALTAASQAQLESLGLWRQIIAERVCPYRDMEVWDGEASGDIGFHARQLGCEQLGHIVENSLLVRHLRRALGYQSAVDWFHPCRLEDYQPADAQTPARIRLDDGQELSADLLVAADGAHSRLRTLAGFAVREWAYGQKAIVTSVRTRHAHGYQARQRFMHTGPLAFLPLRWRGGEPGEDWDCHHSSIVWSADSALADHLMALDDDAFCARLTRDFEARLGPVEACDQRHAIPLYQRHARHYVQPGVALVGDAAHSIHPLAGQGVNLGLKDVAALAGQLTRGLERGLPLSEPSLLRRYQRDRLGDNLAMMALMESFKHLFGSRSAEWIWLRNEGLRRVNALPLVKNTLARKAMGV